jgi:hypothetical protein
MLPLFLVLVAPAFVLGMLTGAGPAAIVGAFAGLFAFISVAGGPLWSDLRALATWSPVLLVAACGPRLLAEGSRPAAFALILVLVLVAGLLPLVRPGLTTRGLGLGLLTLISYGLPMNGPVGALQLLVAVVSGLVVAALFRFVTGIADPHRPTREKAAALLDADADPDGATDGASSLTDAVDLWLRDGRPAWIAGVIAAASRARIALDGAQAAARRLPEPDRETAAIEQVRARAARVGDAVRAKKPATPETRVERPRSAALATAGEALDEIETRAAERDRTPVVVTERFTDRVRDGLAQGTGAWRSAQVRHALRTTLGVLLALLVSLSLRPGDALLTTLLMTTFAILQTSWDATLERARPKILGLVLGALLTVGILLTVPPALTLPIALVALVVGLGFITSRPVLGNAAMVCVSVGFNSSMRGLDPIDVLAEYGLLIVLAILIGLVAGYGVIPAHRPPTLRRRLDDAVTGTASALRALHDTHGSPDRVQTAGSWQAAVAARRALVPDHDRLTDDQTARLEQLRRGLDDVAALGALTARDPDADLAAIAEACDRLERGRAARLRPASGMLPALAEEVHGRWQALRADLAAPLDPSGGRGTAPTPLVS